MGGQSWTNHNWGELLQFGNKVVAARKDSLTNTEVYTKFDKHKAVASNSVMNGGVAHGIRKESYQPWDSLTTRNGLKQFRSICGGSWDGDGSAHAVSWSNISTLTNNVAPDDYDVLQCSVHIRKSYFNPGTAEGERVVAAAHLVTPEVKNRFSGVPGIAFIVGVITLNNRTGACCLKLFGVPKKGAAPDVAVTLLDTVTLGTFPDEQPTIYQAAVYGYQVSGFCGDGSKVAVLNTQPSVDPISQNGVPDENVLPGLQTITIIEFSADYSTFTSTEVVSITPATFKIVGTAWEEPVSGSNPYDYYNSYGEQNISKQGGSYYISSVIGDEGSNFTVVAVEAGNTFSYSGSFSLVYSDGSATPEVTRSNNIAAHLELFIKIGLLTGSGLSFVRDIAMPPVLYSVDASGMNAVTFSDYNSGYPEVSVTATCQIPTFKLIAASASKDYVVYRISLANLSSNNSLGTPPISNASMMDPWAVFLPDAGSTVSYSEVIEIVRANSTYQDTLYSSAYTGTKPLYDTTGPEGNRPNGYISAEAGDWGRAYFPFSVAISIGSPNQSNTTTQDLCVPLTNLIMGGDTGFLEAFGPHASRFGGGVNPYGARYWLYREKYLLQVSAFKKDTLVVCFDEYTDYFDLNTTTKHTISIDLMAHGATVGVQHSEERVDETPGYRTILDEAGGVWHSGVFGVGYL